MTNKANTWQTLSFLSSAKFNSDIYYFFSTATQLAFNENFIFSFATEISTPKPVKFLLPISNHLSLIETKLNVKICLLFMHNCRRVGGWRGGGGSNKMYQGKNYQDFIKWRGCFQVILL